MSQTLVQRPTPAHELSSRDVINVDDLVVNNSQDDDVQFISIRPSHEPIVIEDSDDEVEIVAGPSRPRAPLDASVQQDRLLQRPSRRLLFSPPPPPQDNSIPPVPPLPPRARAEPPLRWRLTPDASGVIRPLEHPFAFEQGFQEHPRLPPIRNAPWRSQEGAAEPNVMPRLNNMGLGGALYALNRRNENNAMHPAPAPARERNINLRHLFSEFGLAPFRMLLQRYNGVPEPLERDEEDFDLLAALALDAEEQQPDQQFRLFQRPFVHRHAPPQQRQESDYKPNYTHPEKVEVGFSNDFAPPESITVSDGPGPSSAPASDAHTVLVCAMCLNPLLMNVIGSEEQRRKSKLFALRCGHILDGPCIDSLMKPAPEPLVNVELDNDAYLTSGRGKAKATDLDGIGFPESDGPSHLSVGSGLGRSSRKDKGKQRATRADEDIASEFTMPAIPAKRSFSADGSLDGPTEYTRTRLRPRFNESSVSATEFSADPTIPATNQVEDSLLDHVSRSSATRRRATARRGRQSTRGKSRGKGKGKVTIPVIEATYEWRCPVSNCGRLHKSVLILGEWRMDEGQGAIPMYV